MATKKNKTIGRRGFIEKAFVSSAALACTQLYDFAVPMGANALSTSGGIGIEEALYILEKGKPKNIRPEIRPEIVKNPRAVFLIETHVDALRDSKGFFTEAAPQLEEEGKRIAKEVFVKGTQGGGSTMIKPNFTLVAPEYRNRTCGVMTKPDFIAGFIDGLRELGNTNVMCGERMPNGARSHRQAGIYDVFDPKDINLLEANYAEFSHHTKNDLNWRKVPDSLIWKNIPYWRPIGDKDCFLVNMPTMKVHTTGITTLAVKNLQGAVPTGYGYFCYTWQDLPFGAESWGINFKRDFHEDYQPKIEASFRKHLNAGFEFWDYEKSYDKYLTKGGWDTYRKIKDNRKAVSEFTSGMPELMRDEMWLQRGLDNAETVKPNINIIEGIIGMDGAQHGFLGVGRDYLCNIVIVGLSPFEVDAVGTYIMGHDPSEVWYTRVAKERGLGECDVNKIDIYTIRDGEVIPVKDLSQIKRYRLGVNLHTWNETGKRLIF